MGAYLSEPITEKDSEDSVALGRLTCGLSQMQGWRMAMEDAHNCVPVLKENMSLFGVYDGHGGREVALYCALHLPNILKDRQSFKDGNYAMALKEVFLTLDKALLDPETLRELKVLADRRRSSKGPVTEEEKVAFELRSQEEETMAMDEMELLHEEATMTIEELLARYGQAANDFKTKLDAEKSKNEAEASEATGSESAVKEGKPSGSGGKELEDVVSSTSDISGSSTETQQETSCDVSSSSSTPVVSLTTQDDVADSSRVSSTDDSWHTALSSSTERKITDDNEAELANESEAQSRGDPGAIQKANDAEKSKLTSGKIRPKRIKAVKLGVGDDEDFDPGSESDSDDGFDSDEAVEGSSESDDEEEDEKDMDGGTSWVNAQHTNEEPGVDSGTTSVVALLNGFELIVANAGDSRCVLCRDGDAFDLSADHKPEDDSEIERILAAGGQVNIQGRVNGGLNVSRAIGDHSYKRNTAVKIEKQMISAVPDIKKVTLRPGDEFIVMACDGIWNVLTSKDVVSFVRARLPPQGSNPVEKLSLICEELIDSCLASDTTGDGTGCDNMTCIVVRFNEDWLAQSRDGNNEICDVITAEIVDEEKEPSKAVNNDAELKINGNGNPTVDLESVANAKRPRTDIEVEKNFESGLKKQKVTENLE